MQITDVKVSIRDDTKLKAFVTITLDDCFVVRGIKIIRTDDKVFVAMPARRKPDGTFQDIAHPINAEARRQVEGAILEAYERVMVLVQ